MASYDTDLLRSHIPVLSEWTYLNTGTVGVMPDPVFEALIDSMRDYEQGGHTTQHRAMEGAERAKERLGNLLGVPGHEIALNRNATDGINTVAAGFPLQSGDEVITSSEEHPAMVLPWLAACDRANASLQFVELSANVDEFRRSLSSIVTDRTRIVAISHVSCETGLRVPVQVIREVVGPDVAILVDASQSAGQFPFSIAQLTADFVIGNGHKWLAGPKGTGFIWLDPGSIHLAPPVYFASDTFDPPWSRDHYQRCLNPAIRFSNEASRYEMGTRAWHLHAGLTAAIDYQAEIGWQNISEHLSTMSSLAKLELNRLDGVTIHTPEKFSDSSGLVTFSLDEFSGVDLSGLLWNDYNIAQRRVERPSAVRVSCAYFCNEDDIAKLVAAVAEISRSRAKSQ